MPLRRFRRHYEQLSQFKRERIIGMMEAGWSARRVARSLDHYDCVLRRCWDQWIREMSFTRRPGSDHPLQTSRREDSQIPITWDVLEAHASITLFGVVPRTRNLDCSKWNQVVFSDESRFNLSSDDNCVRVWRPRGEHFNPAFALQRHTAPTAGVMVWGAIAYNTWSPLALIGGTMTAQRYVHDILQSHVLPLMQRLSGAIFQQDNARPHLVRVSQDCTRTVTSHFLTHPIPKFVFNRAYLGAFGMVSWASHEFERTRGKVTGNMDRNVSRHHAELICLDT
ncbi:transposable element Tcb1 transposase [Trichonephila clavipes]|uniref:Transposable element Tcb1 transposase n=1 Tax=Trichonephila clavipes TaxID=2585209 RepID=A0A8X6SST7_TRICX|nr:transposable element Tcb1 transposase [Trichonephila clavipes]